MKIKTDRGWVFVWTRSYNRPEEGFVVGSSFSTSRKEARAYIVKAWRKGEEDPRNTWRRVYRAGGRVWKAQVSLTHFE